MSRFSSRRRDWSWLSAQQSLGSPPTQRGRSVWVLLTLLILWSLCLGWGMAQATEPVSRPVAAEQSTLQPSPIGTVDRVSQNMEYGQKVYLQACATCHVGLPPAVMPSETWRQLLQDPQHYGTEITPLNSIDLQAAWRYLRDYSRPQSTEETTPYRLYQSRYFKVLHPRVKFSERVGIGSCVTCHPGASQYDFRKLSAEWQNAP